MWREEHFEVKSVKNCGVRRTFGRSNVVLRGRRTGLCRLPRVSKTRGFVAVSTTTTTTLYYTILHYTPLQLQLQLPLPLQYTTLHYITLHFATLHYLHYTSLHSIMLHYNYNCSYTTLHYTMLITLHYTTLITLHHTNYITLHYITLH